MRTGRWLNTDRGTAAAGRPSALGVNTGSRTAAAGGRRQDELRGAIVGRYVPRPVHHLLGASRPVSITIRLRRFMSTHR